MKKIIIVYSPLCEANAAFIGKIHEWLEGKNVEIEECSYEVATKKYKELIELKENCFIDVYFEGKCIDSVPLHRERLLAALGINNTDCFIEDQIEQPDKKIFSEVEIRKEMQFGNIEFIPITDKTYQEEMSMCLHNYPRGNPPIKYHKKCIEMKKDIFAEVFQKETVAGIYAKMNGNVIGLLEVFPREIVRKFGYMTGTTGEDEDTLTVACYEIGYGIPRILMIDELMYHLLAIRNYFSRKNIEGIGVYEWNDGFNPYWVYEKYGFHKTEEKNKNMVVMKNFLC